MTPWETTRPIPRDPMKLVKSAQLPASLHFTRYESHSFHQLTSAGVSIFDPLICARREELRPLYHDTEGVTSKSLIKALAASCLMAAAIC